MKIEGKCEYTALRVVPQETMSWHLTWKLLLSLEVSVLLEAPPPKSLPKRGAIQSWVSPAQVVRMPAKNCNAYNSFRSGFLTLSPLPLSLRLSWTTGVVRITLWTRWTPIQCSLVAWPTHQGLVLLSFSWLRPLWWTLSILRLTLVGGTSLAGLVAVTVSLGHFFSLELKGVNRIADDNY